VRKLIKFFLILSASTILASCKDGVKVDSDYSPPITGSSPDGLSLVLPSQTPFYTSDSSVGISGFCRENSRVLLQGELDLSQDCVSGNFSFDVSLLTDKSYSFSLTQQRGEFLSNPIPFLVVKKTSVSQPALTYPTENPFGSASTSLTVTGTCETGSSIELLVDSSLQSTECINSEFSSTISKFSDGSFPVRVTQIDQAGNSAFTEFVWTKQDLSANPPSPQIVVDQSQIFTIEGGTSPYDVQLTANNSGATFDIPSLSYTAGTVSGVVDELLITDALGFTTTVSITVLPDVADRFEFPTLSGNFQTAEVGKRFLQPIVARVVDKYGNAVPNFNVVFKKVGGDLGFMDTRVISTNTQGEASLILNQGYTSVRSSVVTTPLIGSLPDIGATGRGSLVFSLNSSSNNTGNLGLDFDVGNGAENTLVALLNSDALDDVLVLNKGDRTVDIYLGDSSGVLNSFTRVTGLCNSPTSMIGGDFDEDSFYDFVITCASASFYYLYRGLGSGAFSPPDAIATDIDESLILDAFSEDINADGHLDLTFASTGTNKLSVRYGVGDGTFQNPTIYDTSDTPVKIRVSDVDNTNGMDLVVLTSSSPQRVEVFLNNGSGLFIAPNASNTYFVSDGSSSLLTVDVTGDNFDEFIVVNNISNNLSTYVNNGNGTFALPIDTPTGDSPIHAHVFNFDSNSNPDIFVANIGDNNVSVFSGNGNGSFTPEYLIKTKISPIFINSLDINQDNASDLLVVANGDSQFQVFPGNGNSGLGLDFEIDSGSVDVLGLDFNNDEIRDKAVLSRNLRTLKLYAGDNKGQFVLGQTISVGLLDPVAFSTDDFNADGFDDLAVINSVGTNLTIYLNNAGLSFSNSSPIPVGSQPSHIASGDLDSDGFSDIVVTNSGANDFSIFLNDGSGGFSKQPDMPTGAQPLGVQLADFNSDRILDAVVVNGSEAVNSLAVFNGVGDGTFTSATFFTAESSPSEVVVGYFNTDNVLDIAVLNTVSASVSIFIGENSGGFRSASNYFVGADAIDLKLADVDGDSSQDLLISNGINQNFRVLYGSPSGIFTTTNIIETDLNTTKMSVDDVNSDGSVDISILGETTSTVKTYLGH